MYARPSRVQLEKREFLQLALASYHILPVANDNSVYLTETFYRDTSSIYCIKAHTTARDSTSTSTSQSICQRSKMAGRRTTIVQSLTESASTTWEHSPPSKRHPRPQHQGPPKQHDKPLRLENLDTDIPPRSIAVEATTAAISRKEDNSYLPLIGQLGLSASAKQQQLTSPG